MLVFIKRRFMVEELDQMKIAMIFTNDWELFGEGSGDFIELQENPLKDMLTVFGRHGARLTLLAEVGQQWAHRALAEPWAQVVADRWDYWVSECIRLGHDVQLHLHPTWLNARYVNKKWCLDLNNWQLASLKAGKIEEVLKLGRKTLENLGQKENPAYRCVAFRAGAFCIQPETVTLPPLQKAGLICDTSVVPGLTDYLFFDFSRAQKEPGSYVGQMTDLGQKARPGEPGLLELPIHTAQKWDYPFLRRMLPRHWTQKWMFGVDRDPTFDQWAALRDQRIREIYPSDQQPLKADRARAMRNFKRWAGLLVRRSTIVLDYDFLSPDVFLSLVETAAEEAQGLGKPIVTLVALGHSKNIHTAENIDRIIEKLRQTFGTNLAFKTMQQAVEEHAREN